MAALLVVEYSTRDALMRATAEKLAAILSEAVTTRGAGCAALSGGSTPEPAYRALASIPVDWTKVTFALVDERFVPATNPSSNAGMIQRALAPAFDNGATFVPMYGAAGDLDQAAARADALYAPLRIDVALMGMGVDGHTASWFPGAAKLSEALAPHQSRTVIGLQAPGAQASTARLTLTRAAIARAATVILLIAGAEKRARLERALTCGDAPVSALFESDMPPPQVLWAP